jgi:hypothetical protein
MNQNVLRQVSARYYLNTKTPLTFIYSFFFRNGRYSASIKSEDIINYISAKFYVIQESHLYNHKKRGRSESMSRGVTEGHTQ